VMWLLGRLAPDHKTIADFPEGQRPGVSQGMCTLRRTLP
jgi:hypothetical protein